MKRMLLAIALSAACLSSFEGIAQAQDPQPAVPLPAVKDKDNGKPAVKEKVQPKGKTKPAQVVDKTHPPRIGVVTSTYWVTVRRWPGNVWVSVPVTRTDYITVYWNPTLSVYGVWDGWGNFHPYFGPLLGPEPKQ